MPIPFPSDWFAGLSEKVTLALFWFLLFFCLLCSALQWMLLSVQRIVFIVIKLNKFGGRWISFWVPIVFGFSHRFQAWIVRTQPGDSQAYIWVGRIKLRNGYNLQISLKICSSGANTIFLKMDSEWGYFFVVVHCITTTEYSYTYVRICSSFFTLPYRDTAEN